MQEIVLDPALSREALIELVTRAQAAMWQRFMSLNDEVMIDSYKLWSAALGRAAQNLKGNMHIELVQRQLTEDYIFCTQRERGKQMRRLKGA